MFRAGREPEREMDVNGTHVIRRRTVVIDIRPLNVQILLLWNAMWYAYMRNVGGESGLFPG
jgi:hypothetical protein